MSSSISFAPYDTTDAYLKNFAETVNSHTLHAGRGINITKGSNGIMIHSKADFNKIGYMNYRGTYDTASQYFPYDVVFVDPNITYYSYVDAGISCVAVPYEATASYSRPPICAGLFICCNVIPYVSQSYGLFTSSVLPAYSNVNRTVDNLMADTYRHYQYNVYYPVYPTIPSASTNWKAVSGSSGNYLTVANQTFWMPLTPYLPARFCYNNVETTMFLAGIVSGSSFDSSKLPYSGSFP